MSVQQQSQQYNAAKPRSKRLTIIDENATGKPYWTIQRFYIKRVRDVRGAQTDTKKVRVKIREKHWPFDNSTTLRPWSYSASVVFTHTKVDYDVYSGHIDDITDKSSGWLLELYVTDVKDQT